MYTLRMTLDGKNYDILKFVPINHVPALTEWTPSGPVLRRAQYGDGYTIDRTFFLELNDQLFPCETLIDGTDKLRLEESITDGPSVPGKSITPEKLQFRKSRAFD